MQICHLAPSSGYDLLSKSKYTTPTMSGILAMRSAVCVTTCEV